MRLRDGIGDQEALVMDWCLIFVMEGMDGASRDGFYAWVYCTTHEGWRCRRAGRT